jgi:hypothetical protein
MIEAAATLRRLLDAIDKGEIDADDPKGRALHRRLEGVVAAWEEGAGDTFGQPGGSEQKRADSYQDECGDAPTKPTNPLFLAHRGNGRDEHQTGQSPLGSTRGKVETLEVKSLGDGRDTTP